MRTDEVNGGTTNTVTAVCGSRHTRIFSHRVKSSTDVRYQRGRAALVFRGSVRLLKHAPKDEYHYHVWKYRAVGPSVPFIRFRGVASPAIGYVSDVHKTQEREHQRITLH